MSRYNKFNVDDINNDINPDNIYVDATVRNLGDGGQIRAEFNQTKSEIIVDNPSDYYLTLVRWSLPAFNLPLAYMSIINNQSDPNLSQYSVTLQMNADIQPKNLIYISRNSNVQPDNAIPEQKITNYYRIFEYQHMLDMVNTAFINSFNSLLSPPVGSIPPYVIYNSETQLFSLIAQTEFYRVVYTPANLDEFDKYPAQIKIWMNIKLFQLFNGWASYIPKNSKIPQNDGRDIQILVDDYHNNLYNEPGYMPTFPPLFFQIQQQLKSISTWSPVKQIIFETSLIPINSEYTSVSNNSFKKILTDFEPIKSSEQDTRTLLQYFPQGVYRLVDLVGTNPLYNIDIKACWLDVYGHIHVVTIPFLHQMTAKILFVKRSLYKTQNQNYH